MSLEPNIKLASRIISRGRAASMLRAARDAFATGSPHAGEPIGWAVSVLRDSRQARRLKIDLLIRVANYDSADALIARCIMHGQDHPLIRMRFAQSLLEQGRLPQADAEIRLALQSRPEHSRALCLGARIAQAMRQPRRAAALLERACHAKPSDDATRSAFVEALLNCGCMHYAAAQLKHMASPPPALTARVLAAQGRTLESIEVLEGGIIAAPTKAELNACMRELIQALEASGDAARLRELLNRHRADFDAATGARAALTMLAFGEVDQAVELLSPPETADIASRSALRALTVAHSLAGRRTDAVAALNALQASFPRRAHVPASDAEFRPNGAAERSAMADAWLRGLIGRLISAPMHNRELNADPATSVLQRLLQDAAIAFEREIREMNSNDAEIAIIERHRAICLQAMGRVEEAAAALGRALALADSSSPRDVALKEQPATSIRRAA